MEKKGEIVRIEKVEDAIDFGGDSYLPPPPNLTPTQEKKLWRKIDLRLLPILTLMYLCSFLDRGTFLYLCLDISNILKTDQAISVSNSTERNYVLLHL